MKKSITLTIEVGDGGSDRWTAEEQREEAQYWATMTLDVLKTVLHNLDKAARIAERSTDHQLVDFTTITITQDPDE